MANRFRTRLAPGGKVPPEVSSVKDKGQPLGFGPDWIFGGILVIAVILTYLPVWRAGFVWDDSYHVTSNPCIIGPLGLKEIWTSGAGRLFPLVLTTFWLEHALWGLEPMGYHGVNVIQHAISAVLLWRVLLSLRVPGAWLGAALWALHPLQVESVAWISEMKNTQSCVFYLLTILFFLRWLQTRETQKPAGWNYLLALLCAVLAMASKPSTVVLPAVLFLCAWWIEGRLPVRHILRILPVVLMSIISIAVTMWPQPSDSAIPVDPQWVRTWPERTASSGDVIWFYFAKMLWPHPLMVVYPRWHIDAGQPTAYLPLLAAMILFLILWLKRDSWARPAFFSFSYYLVVLSPFLGLIDQTFWRYSFVEDHLQYLAAMGPLALLGAGLIRVAEFVSPNHTWRQTTLCSAILLILGMLSWQRALVFENSETLWTDALAKNRNCWAAYNNLGQLLLQNGYVDAAMADYQKALSINPSDAEALSNVGVVLLQKGHTDAAVAVLQKALKINPRDAEAYNNLGNAFLQKGSSNDAITQYRNALKMNPFYDEAHNNLGVALSQNGQLEEGISQFEEALRLNPNFSGARQNLANAQAIVQHAPETK